MSYVSKHVQASYVFREMERLVCRSNSSLLQCRIFKEIAICLSLVDVLQNIHWKSSEYREEEDDNAQTQSLVAGDEQVSSQAVFALEKLLPDGPCCRGHFNLSLLAVYNAQESGAAAIIALSKLIVVVVDGRPTLLYQFSTKVKQECKSGLWGRNGTNKITKLKSK